MCALKELYSQFVKSTWESMNKRFTLGILGAGFSGKMLASKLLSNLEFASNSKIYLIDPAFVNGVAYGTPDAAHLLNVRASNMSAFVERPTHFVEFLNDRYGNQSWGSQFVSRKIYSEYLDTVFNSSSAPALSSIEEVSGEVTGVAKRDGKLEVQVNSQTLVIDHLVLACGNIHLDRVPTVEGTLAARAAWPYDQQLLSKNRILFVGTSLTMVDLALSASRLNPNGKLLAVSRNGLLPAVHTVTDPKQIQEIRDIFETQFGSDSVSLYELLSFLRNLSTMLRWQEVVDALRPYTVRLWRGFSLKERRIFIRRLSSLWSIHRHRLSPEVYSALAELITTGRLKIISGRILTANKSDSEFEVTIQERNGEKLKLRVDKIVNCTGPASMQQLKSTRLISSLLDENLVSLDPTGIGLSLADSEDSEVLFTKQISSLGPPIRGELMECTAVPELRVQVDRLANLLHRHFTATPC